MSFSFSELVAVTSVMRSINTLAAKGLLGLYIFPWLVRPRLSGERQVFRVDIWKCNTLFVFAHSERLRRPTLDLCFDSSVRPLLGPSRPPPLPSLCPPFPPLPRPGCLTLSRLSLPSVLLLLPLLIFSFPSYRSPSDFFCSSAHSSRLSPATSAGCRVILWYNHYHP